MQRFIRICEKLKKPKRPPKEPGQQLEEIMDAQRRARQQGNPDRINSIEKSQQRDNQDLGNIPDEND